MLPLSTIILSATTAYSSTLRIDFDGVDERAYTTTMPSQMSAQSGSVSFWIQPDTVLSAPGTKTILGLGSTAVTAPYANNAAIRLRRHASYPDSTATYIEWQIIVNGGAVNPTNVGVAAGVTTKILAGTKYFIVITSSGSANTIYVNGVLQTLGNYGWGPSAGRWWGDNTNTGTKYFGLGSAFGNNAWAATPFDGKLDEVALWNAQLNQTQVTELYNSGTPTDLSASSVAANLENWWKMGESMGGVITTLYDAVGGVNLTSANMENGDIVSVTYP